MSKNPIDVVAANAALGEAVLNLVKESGLLRKKPGRRKAKVARKKRTPKAAADEPAPAKKASKAKAKKATTKKDRVAEALKASEKASGLTE